MKMQIGKTIQNIAEKLHEIMHSGDIDELDLCYRTKGMANVDYSRLGGEYSRLMGALRNRQWNTVRWLLDHGARLTAAEQEEINNCFLEAAFIREMQNVSPDDGIKAP